jgi:hypothetical protein
MVLGLGWAAITRYDAELAAVDVHG